jgi:hypothetical protein
MTESAASVSPATSAVITSEGCIDSLLVENVAVKGHTDLRVTSDPSGRVYPFCVGRGLWMASLHLVEYFNHLPDHLICQNYGRVLELGAGLGAVGMCLARKGASVTVTDVEKMLPLLQFNVSSNFPGESAALHLRCVLLSVCQLSLAGVHDIDHIRKKNITVISDTIRV